MCREQRKFDSYLNGFRPNLMCIGHVGDKPQMAR